MSATKKAGRHREKHRPSSRSIPVPDPDDVFFQPAEPAQYVRKGKVIYVLDWPGTAYPCECGTRAESGGVLVCEDCGKVICGACAVEVEGGNYYCAKCAPGKGRPVAR